MNNSSGIGFAVDNGTSYQDEEFGIDNFCIKDCHEITHSPVSCTSIGLELFCSSDGAQSYSWTGPNGFTSTEQNPNFIFSTAIPKKAYEGTYICTVVRSDGTIRVFEAFVKVPEDCCEAEIEYTREDCINYNFTFSSVDVDVQGQIWTVDGVSFTYTESMNYTFFSPGTHEICVNYLGRNTVTNTVCCFEECVTIEIPVAEVINRIEDQCFYDNFWYNPCDEFSDFDSYTISSPTSSDPGYNTDSKDRKGTYPPYGCISHILLPGQYIFNMYDKDGCLIRTLNYTINEYEYGEENICPGEFEIECGSDLDLNNYFSPECIYNCHGSTGEWTKLIDGAQVPIGGSWVSNITENAVYQRIIENEDECIRCIQRLTFKVIKPVVLIEIPSCERLLTLTYAEIRTLLVQNNVAFCLGNYTSLDITDEVYGNRTISTGSSIQIWSHINTFVIEDPNSCCKVLLKLVCDDDPKAPRPLGDKGNNQNDLNYDKDLQNYENDDENKGQVNKPTNLVLEEVLSTSLVEQSSNVFKLAPNPSAGNFRIINSNNLEEYDGVRILSVDGKVIMTSEDVSALMSYDLSDQSAGIYFVEITAGESVQRLRLVLHD